MDMVEISLRETARKTAIQKSVDNLSGCPTRFSNSDSCFSTCPQSQQNFFNFFLLKNRKNLFLPALAGEPRLKGVGAQPQRGATLRGA